MAVRYQGAGDDRMTPWASTGVIASG